LALSAGNLSPAFSPDVTDYAVTPTLLHAVVQVTPTVMAPGATVAVDGFPLTGLAPSAQVALGNGSTSTSIVVTAPDGTTTRTYTVVFTRNPSALASLLASAGPLSPVFSSSLLAYAVQCGLATATTTLTATAVDPTATLEVQGVVTASGVPSAAIDLAPGFTPITVKVTSGDASATTTYTVLVHRTLSGQQTYVKPANPGVEDSFGLCVAVSGETLVVGAPGEDSSSAGVNGNPSDESLTDSGAVYVFVRSGTFWLQQAYLKASNPGAFDRFGCAVDVAGDTLVVGAQGEGSNATGVDGDPSNNSAGSSGAAYVFVRSGTTWSQQAYLKASNTGSNDRFGASVAISGNTVVVGATFEASNATGIDGNQASNSATESGAAYVFVRSGSTWSQQAYLKASNTGAFDRFGACVALDADTLVVGAERERSDATGVNGDQGNDDANSSGAAYVFVRSGTTWSQQAYLKASNTATEDAFGCSVTISGDTIAVGARSEDSGSAGVGGNQADNSLGDSGAVYVFVRSAGTWTQQAYLKALTPGFGDNLGFSVSLAGDFLLVGAFQEDSNATGMDGDATDNSALESGAAYLFVRHGSTWSQQAYLKALVGGAGDALGYSTAADGAHLVVGAVAEDSAAPGMAPDPTNNGASASGAVYVFR
jgi:hypothetical protein